MPKQKFSPEEIIQRFRSLWILQLYKDYAEIQSKYRLKLRTPLLQLNSLQGTLGQWQSLTRTITLSEELLLKKPWHVVLGVLKHEMAHQIVDEMFNLEDNHGQAFAKACHLLCLEAPFCQRALNLNSLENPSEESDNPLLRRLDKLLSLAQSSNEHEAAAAMERAQELSEKYNIQLSADQSQEASFTSVVIYLNKKQVPATTKIIAALLNEHYFVQVIIDDIYHAMEQDRNKILVIVGEKHHAVMAEYVYHFLNRQIQTLWQTYQKMESVGGKYRISYQQGILRGFLKKLDVAKTARYKSYHAQSRDPHQNPLAVLALNQIHLNDYLRRLFPRLRSSSTSSKLHMDHFSKGQEQGQKLQVSKPLHEKGKSSRYLLGAG